MSNGLDSKEKKQKTSLQILILEEEKKKDPTLRGVLDILENIESKN